MGFLPSCEKREKKGEIIQKPTIIDKKIETRDFEQQHICAGKVGY